jgi:hypothetical protein
VTNATVQCSCCPLIVGFLFAMQPPEAKRLQRKALAVAGWLVVGEEPVCRECAAMLKSTMEFMSRDKARAVKSALSDALFLGRCEVVGVS